MTLSPHRVTAGVRPAGSLHPFAARQFRLMLSRNDAPRQQQLEAARILRQIGYSIRGAVVVEVAQ